MPDQGGASKTTPSDKKTALFDKKNSTFHKKTASSNILIFINWEAWYLYLTDGLCVSILPTDPEVKVRALT